MDFLLSVNEFRINFWVFSNPLGYPAIWFLKWIINWLLHSYYLITLDLWILGNNGNINSDPSVCKCDKSNINFINEPSIG